MNDHISGSLNLTQHQSHLQSQLAWELRRVVSRVIKIPKLFSQNVTWN